MPLLSNFDFFLVTENNPLSLDRFEGQPLDITEDRDPSTV